MDGEYEIDGMKYSFTMEGICLKTQEAWKQAYIDLINQYEAGQYDFEDDNFFSYYQIDSDNQLVLMYEETLKSSIWGDGNDIQYYYGDTQITEEEYETYLDQKRSYETLGGSSGASEIKNEIIST